MTDDEFLESSPVLATADLETTLAFYRDKLGFTIIELHPGFFAVLQRGTATISVSAVDAEWPVQYPNKGGISLRVRDVDALCQELLERGAEFDQGPTNQEYGHRDMSIIDPNGYQIGFWQPIS